MLHLSRVLCHFLSLINQKLQFQDGQGLEQGLPRWPFYSCNLSYLPSTMLVKSNNVHNFNLCFLVLLFDQDPNGWPWPIQNIPYFWKELYYVSYRICILIKIEDGWLFQVGKGLSKYEKAQKLALRHWLEAVSLVNPWMFLYFYPIDSLGLSHLFFLNTDWSTPPLWTQFTLILWHLVW